MFTNAFLYPLTQNSLSLKQPECFTFPFHYQVHPLALIACELLQEKLLILHPPNLDKPGRMYGVLIVRDKRGDLAFLTATSDNVNGQTSHENVTINFVPSIYSACKESHYERQQQTYINQLNQKIERLKNNKAISELSSLLSQTTHDCEKEMQIFRKKMRENKLIRKQKRLSLNNTEISKFEHRDISISLARASVEDKKKLKEIKKQHQIKINVISEKLNLLTAEIDHLRKQRKVYSARLQKHIFKQYKLLNISGETKNLIEIFANTTAQKPPAGSGDCAAPKLLQFAFKHQLTPVCMAEFWWGNQPTSAIRKHKHFYPACQSKCQPILAHMLSGIAVDKNPLLENPAKNIPLEILFSDEHVVVVNKPAGLLSVPGKSIKDSVLTRIKAQFPKASGGMIVHRLDMATSGLLMLALSERAHKNLQKQFFDKRVSKRYVACIDGIVKQQSGKICLPLRGDFEDRPKQMVCHEHGKFAETHWQLISNNGHISKIFLYPITGRTHQLRMHCAHPLGLNKPIIGDSLYGTIANRLHLHAQRLCFSHPITSAEMNFEVNEDF